MNQLFQIIPIQYFIFGMVLCPFLGALISSGFKQNRHIIGPVGLLLSFISSLVVFLTLIGIENARPSMITGEIFSWINLSNISINVAFRIDELSLALIATVSIINAAITAFAISTKYERWTELNIIIGSILLIITGDNLGLIFIGWIISGAALYSMNKNSAATLESTLFFLTAIALISITMNANNTFIMPDSLSLETIETNVVKITPVIFFIASFLTIACIFRIALFPVNRWLELGSSDPVGLACANSLFVLSGVYLLMRIHFLFVLAPALLETVKTLGIISILISSIQASRSLSLVRTLSSSTTFASGLIALSIGFGGFAAAIVFAIIHSILKCALCLTGFSAINDRNGGLIKRFPVSGWCFVISSFILAGVAPGNIFFSMESILEVIKTNSTNIWFLTICLIGLMSFALLRSAGIMFLGRRVEFKPEETELHPAALIPIVAIPTISVAFTFLHASSFFGGTIALPFFEQVLPATMLNNESDKLASGLLLFATIQPAIIAAAVYSQRKWKKEQKMIPSVIAIFKKHIPLPNDNIYKFLFEDVLMNGFGRVLLFVSDFFEIIISKISNWPMLAATLTLIIIMIFGGGE